MKAREFLHEKGMQWNEQLVEGILAPHDAIRVLNLPIATKTKTPVMHYVVDGPWQQIWNSKLPLKIKDFAWKNM